MAEGAGAGYRVLNCSSTSTKGLAPARKGDARRDRARTAERTSRQQQQQQQQQRGDREKIRCEYIDEFLCFGKERWTRGQCLMVMMKMVDIRRNE